jgi:hypothetical protein
MRNSRRRAVAREPKVLIFDFCLLIFDFLLPDAIIHAALRHSAEGPTFAFFCLLTFEVITKFSPASPFSYRRASACIGGP